MGQWFAIQSEHVFQPFSFSHLIILAIAAGGLATMIATFKKWASFPLTYQLVRWFLFSLLFISEVSYFIWTQLHGIWSISAHTPLHLCGIASLLAMFALVFQNKNLIQLSFFYGIIPAFLALISPDVPYDFHHYRFWKFFVHHTAIPWACLFLALSRPAVIHFSSLVKSYVYLCLYSLFIGLLFNPLTGANYLYLQETPAANTPLDLLGEGAWYYINLSLTALLLFTIQYVLWKWLIRKKWTQEN